MITSADKPEDIVEQFSTYLAQLGYSSNTRTMLPAHIKDLWEYLGKPELTEINQVQIQSFLEYLQTRPFKRREGALSESYIYHHVYGCRVFFNWLEETGVISSNPMSVLRFKAPKANTRQPLSQQEIQELFSATENIQERVSLHLFYSCGLRRMEAEALNATEIHFKQNILYVREGKGAKRRAVPMPVRVSKELESFYFTERMQRLNPKNTDAFMLNRIGERMKGDNYNKLLKKILARTDITKAISLHHLLYRIATIII